MFERFTERAGRVVVLAQEQARDLGHDYVGTEHLLLGLVVEGDGVAARVLRDLGVSRECLRSSVADSCGPGRLDARALATIGIDLDEVRRRVDATFGPGALERTRAGKRFACGRFMPRAKQAIELALQSAVERGDRFIGTEHLLLGLVGVPDSMAVTMLHDCGITPAEVREAVDQQLGRWNAAG
jgi:ATP-dependent Clp protease ATP-binding subunit ClpA